MESESRYPHALFAPFLDERIVEGGGLSNDKILQEANVVINTKSSSLNQKKEKHNFKPFREVIFRIFFTLVCSKELCYCSKVL